MYLMIKKRSAAVFITVAAMLYLFLYSCGGDYPSKETKTGPNVQDDFVQGDNREEDSSEGDSSGSSAMIKLITPETGSFLNDTVRVSASVSETPGVSRVAFYVDENDIPVYSSTEPPPYVFDWDTTSVSNQVHTIRVEVTDDAGNTTIDAAKIVVINRNESNCPGSGSTWDLTGKWATRTETDQTTPTLISEDFIYIIQDSPCEGNSFDSWGYNADDNEFIWTSGTIFSDNLYELYTDTYPRKYIKEVDAWLQIDRIYWTPPVNGDSFDGKVEVTLYKTETGDSVDYVTDPWFPDVVITGTR